MKKIIVCLMMVALMLQMPTTARAEWIIEDGIRVLTPDSYTEDGKIKVYNLFDKIDPTPKLTMELPKIDISLPRMTFVGADGEIVEGQIIYPNRESIIPGAFDLEWVFTPNDNKYETISGALQFEVYPEDSDISKGIIPIQNELPDEPTVPSLTATSVLLENRTAYDININDKITGSKYNWTSSDTEVVEVNQKNGKLKAISEGEAIVTCEITLPDETLHVLNSVVTIGYDENAPELTETILDLNVGDKFDINLENKIAKSKYRWVSSDRDIVRVNSANGKVTARGIGEAYVTCTITTPENQVIVLRCDISITE